jgi:hypothetical protein
MRCKHRVVISYRQSGDGGSFSLAQVGNGFPACTSGRIGITGVMLTIATVVAMLGKANPC